MRDDVCVRVAEPSQVGEARRQITGLAQAAGFDETASGRLAIVVTELGTNIIDHAGDGHLFARMLVLPEGEPAVEVLTVDRGPGIPDVRVALRDGFTTRKSAGTGLGAVYRMTDDFHVHSIPGEGTVVLAILMARPKETRGGLSSDVGVLRCPHPRERLSGDAWGLRREDGRIMVAVVDGLGHGPGAREASSLAIDTFLDCGWQGTLAAVEAMHGALRRTRGAAVGVLEVGEERREARYTGIGNVAASVIDGEKTSLLSRNGTVGLKVRKAEEYVHRCAAGCLFVLHSDGIRARWGADEIRAVIGRAPSLVAGVLHLLHYRGNDDATVVVLGSGAPGGGKAGNPEVEPS